MVGSMAAEFIRLRRLVEADLPTLHRWYQTEALWDHLVGEFRRHAAEDSIPYMRAWLTPNRAEVRMGVTRAPDDELIGMATPSPIDPEAGEAEFHIIIGDAAERGKGFGEAATVAALEHAFEVLALWRVRLRVLQTNAVALRLYARLGFGPDEGRGAGQTAIKAGAPVAVVALSVTEATFRQRQSAGAHRWSARNAQRSSG
jgi:RimJ/RimL family protein N-acetyltransferase